ncbi:unnamed protein product [Didymodactylos carnosus]|uniref:Uncharacterized protein n=1 Tax=Didymodactylos carnosus TaxID=1234261 RepID=A0A8S2XRQ8_9BILA|nr:unnamed protein product [Didymodactylos carnosus]
MHNAAICAMAPLFFAFRRRNYAPLTARYIFDLQVASPQLIDHLSKSFSVQRTARPFSAIAVDQTIECTINRYGKGRGGISGHFSKQLIDRWCQAFSFRAILSSVIAEIVSLETGLNSLDTHIEYTPTRIVVDNKDLSLCITKLKSENLFSCEQNSLSKLFTGKIIHNDIVLNICNSYERGYELLKKYSVERLINKTVNVYDKIDFGKKCLYLKDTDRYSSPSLKLIKSPTHNQLEAYIRRLFVL